MAYKVKYRRVIEGEMIVDANSVESSEKKVAIELACGTAPVTAVENHFLFVEEVTES